MTLFDHQESNARKLAELLRQRGCAFDLSATGTGKTLTALRTAQLLGRKAFVVAPLAVHASWERAAEELGVPLTAVVNLEQLRTGKTQWLAWEERRAKSGRSYKAAAWRLPTDSMIILDEAHRCGAYDSLNAQVCAFAPKPILMLSATLTDTPLRSRAFLHQAGVVPWWSWWREVQARYGVRHERGRGLRWDFSDRSFRDYVAALRPLAVRTALEDLPDDVRGANHISVQLVDGDASEVDDAYASALADAQSQADCELTSLLRARQLAELAKVPAVVDRAKGWMDERGSVVVFAQFRDTCARLSAELGAPVFSGETVGERDEYVDAFQRDDIPALVVQAAAGGVGLSLHDTRGVSPRLALILPSWSAVELRQILGRIWRLGQRSPSQQELVYLRYSSVESRVAAALRSKLHCLDMLNDADLEAA